MKAVVAVEEDHFTAGDQSCNPDCSSHGVGSVLAETDPFGARDESFESPSDLHLERMTEGQDRPARELLLNRLLNLSTAVPEDNRSVATHPIQVNATTGVGEQMPVGRGHELGVESSVVLVERAEARHQRSIGNVAATGPDEVNRLGDGLRRRR